MSVDWWQSKILETSASESELGTPPSTAFAWAASPSKPLRRNRTTALEAWGGAHGRPSPRPKWIDDFTASSAGLTSQRPKSSATPLSCRGSPGCNVDYRFHMTVDDMLDVANWIGRSWDDARRRRGRRPGQRSDLARPEATTQTLPLLRRHDADGRFRVPQPKVGQKDRRKADEVLAGAKWVKCKVTATGASLRGTKVWEVSAESDQY